MRDSCKLVLTLSKRHTIKAQVAVCKKSKRIICTAFSNGKRHDFRLYKESKLRCKPEINKMTDSGFQGIKKIHKNSTLPIKRKRKQKLTKEERLSNRQISSDRALNENVIGMIKRFRVVSEKYRNRRKRFGLRFNLVSGIYNFELVGG